MDETLMAGAFDFSDFDVGANAVEGGLDLPDASGGPTQPTNFTQEEMDFFDSDEFKRLCNDVSLSGPTVDNPVIENAGFDGAHPDIKIPDETSAPASAADLMGVDFDVEVDQMFQASPLNAKEVCPIINTATNQFASGLPLQKPPQGPLAGMYPNTSLGPSYNPLIGWYFPVQMGPMPFQPTSAPVAPMPQHFTPPRCTPSPASAMPSRISTPQSASRHGHGKRPVQKHTYGPEAYLAAQAGGGAYPSHQPGPTPKNARHDDIFELENPMTWRNKKRAPSIVQACICNDRVTPKVKRPKNAFLCFRSHNQKKIESLTNTHDNQTVSKVAGEMWHAASEDEKNKYRGLAKEEKLRHEQTYPDYHYQPGETRKHRFGSQNCRCGAYQTNLAAHKAKLAGKGKADAESSDVEELDEDVPPRAQASRAPAAAVPQPPAPLPGPSMFGFTTPGQRVEAAVYVANLKRQRDGATQASAEEPPAKRRPTRSTRSNVSYVEVNEEKYEDDEVFWQYVDADQEAPVLDDAPGSRPTDKSNNPPVHNTRARSKTPTASPSTVFPDMANNNVDELIDYDALFGEREEEDDDNIIVASHPSRSAKSTRSTRSSKR